MSLSCIQHVFQHMVMGVMDGQNHLGLESSAGSWELAGQGAEAHKKCLMSPRFNMPKP